MKQGRTATAHKQRKQAMNIKASELNENEYCVIHLGESWSFITDTNYTKVELHCATCNITEIFLIDYVAKEDYIQPACPHCNTQQQLKRFCIVRIESLNGHSAFTESDKNFPLRNMR